MTWMTGTYDPELHLLYWGTGNPNPVLAGDARPGDNLYTCSIVALNPDTGKLAWYFQPSPHDTHDWDAVETPCSSTRISAAGRASCWRRPAATAISSCSTDHRRALAHRAVHRHKLDLGLNAKGQPIPDPKKEPSRDGTLVAPSSNGATNWFAPTFSPETGLFYVTASQNYSVFYLTAEGKAEGFAGRDDFLTFSGTVKAIDYQTGKIRWSHDIGGMGAGLLSTAGDLVFAGDASKHVLALDANDGHTLWHATMGANQMNGGITYELDGKQYLVFGGGDSLYAFTLPPRYRAVAPLLLRLLNLYRFTWFSVGLLLWVYAFPVRIARLCCLQPDGPSRFAARAKHQPQCWLCELAHVRWKLRCLAL